MVLLKKEAKLDPRVRRTRLHLREALIGLIAEKGFDATTVQDITDRAMLNRATFYLHYADKHDLLQRTLQAALDDLADETIFSAGAGEDPDEHPALGPITRMLEHVAARAEFYRVLLGEGGVLLCTSQLRDQLVNLARKWMVALDADAEGSLVPMEIVVNFLGSAYLGTITWWLENDMPYEPDYLARQLMQLTEPGVASSLSAQS
jgi:AcrR family transcriptional regulator